MNRKHSFAVRCLALVLALVLILSNANLGLTMHAQAAAETGSLFELIAASDCGTKELNAILAYADALPNLNDETVTYETAPEAADAKLRLNTLAVNEVNGWVPFTYTVGVVTENFGAPVDGTYSANVGEAAEAATVVYKLDLNKDEQVKLALDLVAGLANEAAQQVKALNDVCAGNALTALGVLDLDFTWELIDAIDSLTVEEAGLDQEDLDEDGDVDEIDAYLAEEELKIVKADYKAVIEELKGRMVDKNDPYYSYVNANSGKHIYEENLHIYAILKEFKKVGLSHFYLNAADVINEMEVMGDILNRILGEKDENKVYENAEVVDALLEKMGEEDVTSKEMGKMADRMTTGAANLEKYVAYKTQIDATSANLVELANALTDCGKVSGYKTDLCLYSKEFLVKDDSYKYVDVKLIVDADNEKVVATRFNTDAVLTEADVEGILAKIAFEARHYDFDASSIEDLVGTAMTADVELTIPAQFKVYTLNVVDAEGNVVDVIEVLGNAQTITLAPAPGHETTYMINGVEQEPVTYPDTLTFDINIDAVAAGEVEIVVTADIDHYKEDLEALIEDINAKLGREAFVLSTDEEGNYNAMTGDIAMDELVVFAETFVDSEMYPVELNNVPFIVLDAGTTAINVQALVDAMLNDETFTSEKMIAMGNGQENNLLTSTIQVPGYDMAFTLNLTTMPSQMTTVAKGLKAVEDFFWFKSNEGILDVSVYLPEKAYEAYLTAAIGTGYMDDDNFNLKNEVAMRFVADFFDEMMSMNIDENTFTNTMKAMHIDKDMSDFYDYYAKVKAMYNYGGFNYTINENSVDFEVTGNKDHIEMLLDIMGLNSKDLEKGLKLVSYDPITTKAVVNLVNDVPQFDALVIEPGKINDAGIKSKLNTIDYTTNLVTKAPTIGKISSVTLLDDIDGNLNFSGNVILDLNGKTINGSVNVGGKVVIIDSNLATFDGGKVTGNVYANGGAILGGTFGGDVSAFLRDGYYQENGAVRNAMYYIVGNNGNYTYVLNADFYQLCDGYLPSIEALAVDIATDVALNAYPAAGMAYDGKMMYALNLESLLNSYLGNGVGGAFDALMTDLTTFVNVDGINALANAIIDDMTNLEAMAYALNNNEIIGRRYSFTSYPATVKIEHNEESNTLDFGFVANTNHPKNFSVAMKIEGENDYYAYAKKVLTAMSEVLFIDAEVQLNQPVYNAASNKVTVGGGAYADVTIDFTKDIDFTKGIAIILAYGNPDRAEELMNAKNCVMELNKIIADMTVEEVFTALKVMNRNVSMTEMADAVGYKYGAEDIAKLEKAYHVLLCGMGKTLELLDVTGNDTKLSGFADGTGSYTIDAYNKSVDATVKGFTGVAELDFARFSLTIKLAPKCDKPMGDADYNGKVNGADAYLIACYAAKDPTAEPHLCVSDVNADTKINGADSYDIGIRSVNPEFVFEAEKTVEE